MAPIPLHLWQPRRVPNAFAHRQPSATRIPVKKLKTLIGMEKAMRSVSSLLSKLC